MASTEYATVHGSRPAKQAPATCVCGYNLRVLPIRCSAGACTFPSSPLSPSSITAPPPLGHSPQGRQRHKQSTPSSRRLLPVRRADRLDSPSALRLPDRGGRRSSFSGEFPAFLCSACASVGSVVRAYGVVLCQGAWNGFGVEFGSFYAFGSAEMGDR